MMVRKKNVMGCGAIWNGVIIVHSLGLPSPALSTYSEILSFAVAPLIHPLHSPINLFSFSPPFVSFTCCFS
jgi:hypothetical protein